MLTARSAACFVAAALFAIANSAIASAGESARSYVAGYELETPAGIVRASETLGLRRDDATSFVSVSDATGAFVSLPTRFAADGEIVANSFDPSVTCYNMAAAALYSSEQAPEAPAAVFIRFGNDTFSVPLTLQAAGTADGTRTLVGSGATAFTLSNDTEHIPAGIVVDARISVTGGQLSDVVFNEATLVGSPARPVSRMTCSLKTVVPVTPRAPAPVLPG